MLDRAHVGIDDEREGVCTQPLARLGYGRVEPAERCKGQRIPLVTGGIAWIQRNRLPVLRLRVRPIVVGVGFGKCERRMSAVGLSEMTASDNL